MGEVVYLCTCQPCNLVYAYTYVDESRYGSVCPKCGCIYSGDPPGADEDNE